MRMYAYHIVYYKLYLWYIRQIWPLRIKIMAERVLHFSICGNKFIAVELLLHMRAHCIGKDRHEDTDL